MNWEVRAWDSATNTSHTITIEMGIASCHCRACCRLICGNIIKAIVGKTDNTFDPKQEILWYTLNDNEIILLCKSSYGYISTFVLQPLPVDKTVNKVGETEIG